MDTAIVFKILRDVFRKDKIDYPECDVLTFACDTERHTRYRGKHYSPLIDTLQDAMEQKGLRCVSITRIASVIKGEKSHGQVFSPEGGFARAMVLKRLKGIFNRSRYPFSYAEARVWRRVLETTKPKVVIGVFPSRELCSVCHEMGIWVADLQHGVIAESHPWYGQGFRGSEPVQWLPDAFLVWNEGTAKIIRKWASAIGIDIQIVGNPWVDRFRARRPDDELVNELERIYPQTDNPLPKALLSLSWGDETVGDGIIHPHVERFVLDTLDRYEWHFRLHPNQLQGYATDEGIDFKHYFSDTFPPESINWQMASAMPLPLLLSRCDLHITTHSSVCIEAASFGIPSALTDPELSAGGKRSDYYEYLVSAGYADKIGQSYDAITKWFERNENTRIEPSEEHGEAFCEMLDQVYQRVKKCAT